MQSRGFRAASGAEHLGLVSGNHVDETDEIQSVLPMNDEKGAGLVVEEEILTKERPERGRFCRGLGRVKGIRNVAESLDVAYDAILNGEGALERRARSDAGVVIDGVDALANVERSLRVKERTELVTSDGDSPGKVLHAALIFLAVGREAERAIGELVAEAKIAGQEAAKVLDGHANFAFRSEETESGFARLAGFGSFGSEAESGECAEEGAPARARGVRRGRARGHYYYIVVVIRDLRQERRDGPSGLQKGQSAFDSVQAAT